MPISGPINLSNASASSVSGPGRVWVHPMQHIHTLEQNTKAIHFTSGIPVSELQHAHTLEVPSTTISPFTVETALLDFFRAYQATLSREPLIKSEND